MVGVIVALAVSSSLVALRHALPTGAVQPPTAALTVFTGSVTVTRPGTRPAPGHSGQTLAEGAVVETGGDGIAALTFPDGSQTRLDGGTRFTITTLAMAPGGGTAFTGSQASGRSYHQVAQLLGGSWFRVSGPNGASGEVRGTEFEVVIEPDPDGASVVRYDVFDGTVEVRAGATTVVLHSDQSSQVHPGARVEPPMPIPARDRSSAFVQLNRAAAAALAAGATRPVAVRTGSLSEGTASAILPGATSSGGDDLVFTLSWPGSTFELDVLDPAGTVSRQLAASAPPITIEVTDATRGAWSYRVVDVTSDPDEAWSVVVARRPAAAEASPSSTVHANPHPSSHPPSPGAEPGGGPTAEPSGGPTAEPSGPPSANPGKPPDGDRTPPPHGAGSPHPRSPAPELSTPPAPPPTPGDEAPQPPPVTRPAPSPASSHHRGSAAPSGSGRSLTPDPPGPTPDPHPDRASDGPGS